MADKNSREAKLAEAVHAAEYEANAASAAPAGPGRIERILKVDLDLLKAQRAYDDCPKQ
jgi:hypothetical protein